jgi:hypothetical protein
MGTGAGGTVSTGCSDGLITLDGVPLPLEITAQDAALLGTGSTATLHACAPAAPIGAGDHLLTDTAMGGLTVERVVVGAGLDTAGVTATPTVAIERGGDTHTVTVSECPDGCWLIFGEGYSEGWSATSADAELGAHTPISGGFNGWWVAPGADGEATITLHWAGQRPIWIALTVSGVAILLLVVAAAWPAPMGRARRLRVAAPAIVGLGPAEPRFRTAVAALACVAAVAVAVAPHTALWCVLPAAVGVAVRRTRVLSLIGLGGVMVAGARIAMLQFEHDYPAGFWWPMSFETWHPRAFAAALLVTLAAALGRNRTTAQ